MMGPQHASKVEPEPQGQLFTPILIEDRTLPGNTEKFPETEFIREI